MTRTCTLRLFLNGINLTGN
uniref:Uncharacterized protein n=1 Tax=Anguilla anguilla TaxID=7936 RepID=A0A0E9W6B5_ANGAN